MSQLLCDQLEFANVIVLNKCDLLSQQQRADVRKAINLMNPDLIVLGDEYSKFGDSFLENIKIHIQKKILPSVFKNINFQLAPQTDLVIGGSFNHVIQNEML